MPSSTTQTASPYTDQYWIIVTDERNNQQKQTNTFLSNKHKSLCKAFPYAVPKLKITTIDALIELSDELTDVEKMLGNLVRKVRRTYSETLQQDPGKMSKEMITLLQQLGDEPNDDEIQVHRQLMVGEYDLKTPKEYLENFKWNYHLYNDVESIENIKKRITDEFSNTEEELRILVMNFQDLRNQVSAEEKKQTGPITVRPISKYINPEQHIIETEHLTTVFIAVPKDRKQQFLSKYMKLEPTNQQQTDTNKPSITSDRDINNESDKSISQPKSSETQTSTVVPDSALLVIDENQIPDDDLILYRVVLFKRNDDTNIDKWKNLCRDQRWVIRPFEYNKDEDKQNSIILADLMNKRRAAWHYLLMWAETKFDSIYTSWMHIIAAKIFVESILRYGVRAVFSAVLLQPARNQEKKLRKLLENITSVDSNIDDNSQPLGLPITSGINTQEYYPYINFTIDLNDI